VARPPGRSARGVCRGRYLIRLLAPGDPAPDFTLPGSDGRLHTLSAILSETRVLLVFYPGNDTPG
jgi:peroxiredoxin